MGTITIVGLGPGEPRHLTREAWEVLEGARELWLRTERHPTVEGLPSDLAVHSFDALYEEADDFSTVYDAIARRVLALAQRPEGVVYGVPGHPFVGEATVERVLREAQRAGLRTRIVEGLSFVGVTLTALRIDALDGLQIIDAIELAQHHHPPLDPDFPTLVGQLYSRSIAGAVKLTLMNQYPDEHEVALVHAAGTEEQRVDRILLYRLDHLDGTVQTPAHLTTLYIPPLTGVAGFGRFQETVAHLRAPEGCPWDREQTHASLRAGLLEEAYESVAAIDRGDLEGLREELGDLLLQIVLQTQIAVEGGIFKMPEVIAGIDAKLKHRHPHVWGGLAVEGTADVLHNWEALKREEKGERESILEGVPVALPALQQAHTYGERVARVGFDWEDVSGVVNKVREELAELEQAVTEHRREAGLEQPATDDRREAQLEHAATDDRREAQLREAATNDRHEARLGQAATDAPREAELRQVATDDRREAELGDLLFAVANWARWLGVEPETALRKANARFARRFAHLERSAREQGLPLEALSIEELEGFWQQAKQHENST